MENQQMDKEDTHRKKGYRYVLPRSAVYRKIGISEGDHTLLTVYAQHYGIPRTTLLHEMIGCAAKCWEEEHEQTIKELEERSKTMLKIIFAYLERYGPLKKESKFDKTIAEEVARQRDLQKEKEGNEL